MHEEHLHLLRCPLSGEKLKLLDEHYSFDGHIESGVLLSSSHRYPIKRGVPRFLLPQSDREKDTIEAFSEQWFQAGNYSLTYGQDAQYFDSYLHPLRPDEIENLVVLDAGCGNGRLIEYCLNFSPKLIVGLDYSQSVEIAFERTRKFSNVLIVQGSILAPPLKHISFNKIYSLGVIHHLEVPEKGLRQLGKLLNANGKMHVWIYSREGNELYLAVIKPLRWLAKRISCVSLWSLSRLLAILSWPYLFVCFYVKNKLLKTLLPMKEYLSFIFELGFEVYVLVIHDQLAPSIVFHPSKKDVLDWAKHSGLLIFHMDMRTSNSWRIGLRRC
jgi:SAM-dependent methyltransferase